MLTAASGEKVDIIKLNVINAFGKSLLSALLKYKNIVFAEECYYIGGVGMLLQTELDGCGFKGIFTIFLLKIGL